MTIKKVKLVHIVEGFVGGLSTYMVHVLLRLHKKGFDVTLVCSLNRKERGMAEKLNYLRDVGIRIHYVPMKRGINPIMDLYSFILLWKLLNKGSYDIVHTHCSKAGAIGRIAAFVAKVPVRLYSSHCFAYLRCNNKILKKLYYWIERLLSKVTTKYVAVSSSDMENASEANIFPTEKCLMVENGVPIINSILPPDKANMIRSELMLPQNTFIITTGCRFIEYKGLKLLLEAVRYVNGDCRIVIAGEGRLENKLKEYLLKHDLEKKVALVTPTTSMNELLQITDLAILCSSIEAQPYFLLEAMEAKCPIIATDVPGNRELIGTDRGLLVQPDPKAIAKAIDLLLQKKTLRMHFVDSAYDYVNHMHPIKKQIERLTKVYSTELKQIRSPIESKRRVDVRTDYNKKTI